MYCKQFADGTLSGRHFYVKCPPNYYQNNLHKALYAHTHTCMYAHAHTQ